MTAEGGGIDQESIIVVHIDGFATGEGNAEIAGLPRLLRGSGFSPVSPYLEALAKDAGANASALPHYAKRCQSRADLVTTCSNCLAALTGLTIWATVQATPAWWAKVLVAFAALLSAVLGFLPAIYKWGDKAKAARDLASRYGHLYGDLLKLEEKILQGENVNAGSVEQKRIELESLKKQRQEIDG
ncbi:hypothetical protein [Streptomyces sp. CdTB01]|uniref:hypothetical protein n=1 Tax=Streptomyces sp. CdTB01 TaxID=1725411 RepID=UPI00073A69EF|nr:hypothetical protein [Streptomyces sp. CdTB01]ALV35570.1 hypothetical protein AS200_28655 [Streptomyces sp. CdTB01]